MPVIVSDGLHSDSSTVVVNIKGLSNGTSFMRFLNEEYRFNITENQVSEKPQPLGRLTLVNVNTSKTVTYRLLNPSREFVIGINDGLLSWTGISLDREKKSHFKFIIEVSFVDLFRHHFYFLGKFALFFSYKVLL